MMDVIEKIVRELAKSHYWQTVYNNAKELGLKLFKNDTDFTSLQIMFLNYLNFYGVINMDIALNEVSDKVLDNFIYEDAYMYYRTKKSRDSLSDIKSLTDIKSMRQDNNKQTIQWVFKRPSGV